MKTRRIVMALCLLVLFISTSAVVFASEDKNNMPSNILSGGSQIVGASASGTVWAAGEALINDAKSFVTLVSSALAVVGAGIGGFLFATAGGDDSKIRSGKKSIMWSFIAWLGINGMTLLLSTGAKYLV